MRFTSQITGVHYLKSLLRFGLDKHIYLDYKNYGLISCSEMNCKSPQVKAFHFIDFAGIEEDWINQLVSVETQHKIKVYHIIHTKKGEFVCLYSRNYDYMSFKLLEPEGVDHVNEWNDYEEFASTGKTKCFWFYPDTGEIKFGETNVRVRLGGIVET